MSKKYHCPFCNAYVSSAKEKEFNEYILEHRNLLKQIKEAIEVIKFYAQDKYSNNKEYGPEEVLEDEGKKAQQFLEKWGIK